MVSLYFVGEELVGLPVFGGSRAGMCDTFHFLNLYPLGTYPHVPIDNSTCSNIDIGSR